MCASKANLIPSQITNKWANKTLLTYGDSITAQGYWQAELLKKLPMTLINRGTSGTTVATSNANSMNLYSRISADIYPNNFDLLLFMGGTNDWAQNVALGTEIGWDKRANYINPLVRTIGYFVDWTTGNLSANAIYDCSDYFKVLSNSPITLEKVWHYAFYDSAKVFISGGNISGTTTNVTTPANAAYIRVDSQPLNYQFIFVSDQGLNANFYPSLAIVAERLLVSYPGRIVFMSTPFGKYPNRAGFTDTYGLVNNLGLTTKDYGIAIQNVAKKYGFPFIDIYGECGWNDFNIASFVTNDGAYLHPNTEGAKRMAQVIYGRLSEIQPLS